MGQPIIKHVRRFIGAHFPLSALVNDNQGVIATAADISSISYTVQDALEVETDSGTLTPIETYWDDDPSAAWKESISPPNFNWDLDPDGKFVDVDDDLIAATFYVAVTFVFVGGYEDRQVWACEVMPIVP